MPRVEEMRGFIAQLESDFITVHQERCALVRNRNADCLRCSQVCTSGCISFADGELSIDPEKCIGCGTCATVCPTCALEAHHPNDARLLSMCKSAAAANAEKVCIACSHAIQDVESCYDSERVVRVECLGRVEESLLCTLVADGCSDIALFSGPCGACEHATGRAMCETVLETTQTLLNTWGVAADIHIEQDIAQEFLTHEPVELDLSGDNPQDNEEIVSNPYTYMKVMADGTLPHFVPDRRERLLDALAALGEPADVALETRLWGHVSIDMDKCMSCRMCATFCPSGAIVKFDEEGAMGIEHYPGDCVKCRSCETICPKDALTLHEAINATSLLSGTVDRYEMKPLEFERSGPHTIWHSMERFTKIDQVYER